MSRDIAKKPKPFRGKRLEYLGHTGETIYVSQAAFEGIHKKAIVRNIRFVPSFNSAPAVLVIEYVAKKGGNRGTLELRDLGPAV